METIKGKIEFGIIPLFKAKYLGVEAHAYLNVTKDDCAKVDTARINEKRYLLSNMTEDDAILFVEKLENNTALETLNFLMNHERIFFNGINYFPEQLNRFGTVYEPPEDGDRIYPHDFYLILPTE